MKQDKNTEKEQKKKMLGKLFKSPKAIGAAAIIATSIVAATVIAGAGYLKGDFNPDAYAQSSDQSNDVAYDSTVFGANQSQDNGKEMDQESQEEMNLEDGQDPLDNNNKKDDMLLLGDNTSGNSSDNNANTAGLLGTVGDSSDAPKVVLADSSGGSGDGSGSGNGNGTNGSGSGNGSGDNGNNNQSATPTAKPTATPAPETTPGGGTEPTQAPVEPTETPEATPVPTKKPTPAPTVTEIPTPTEDPDKEPEWGDPVSFTATSSSGNNTITLYEYMTPTEADIRNKLKVTATYQDKNNPTNTKSELVSDYTIVDGGSIIGHEFTSAEVNHNYNFSVVYGDLGEQPLSCAIASDTWKVDQISISYGNDSPEFCVGDILGTDAKKVIMANLSVTAQCHTFNGHVQQVIPDYQTSGKFDIQFHDSEGKTDDNIKAEKSVTAANVVLKDSENSSESSWTILPDRVQYAVFNHKLTVMYDNENILTELYQDEGTFRLTAGDPSVFNEMITKLTESGKIPTDSEGNTLLFFYGWSQIKGETDLTKAIDTYTMPENIHSVTLWPLPLTERDPDYIIKNDGNQQILIGYEGKGGTLDIPYGVTYLKVDQAFEISPEESEKITTIKIPPTLQSIDFSAMAEKFPNLVKYIVKSDTGIYRSDNQGALYTDYGRTLLRLPTKAPSDFTVPYSTKAEESSVDKIDGHALDDKMTSMSQGESLNLVMKSPTPPAFSLEQGYLASVKAGLGIQITDSGEEAVTTDYNLKYYASSYGTMLDASGNKTGYALDSVLYTPNHAE